MRIRSKRLSTLFFAGSVVVAACAEKSPVSPEAPAPAPNVPAADPGELKLSVTENGEGLDAVLLRLSGSGISRIVAAKATTNAVAVDSSTWLLLLRGPFTRGELIATVTHADRSKLSSVSVAVVDRRLGRSTGYLNCDVPFAAELSK